MPINIIIREPTTLELPQLPFIEDAAGTLFESWADANGIDRTEWPASTLENLLSMGKPLIAVSGDKVAGFIIYNVRPDESEVYIAELGVHPDFHGHKIGAKLVEAVVEKAKGCNVMTLTTFSHIPWNGPYYQKYLGFRILEEHELTNHTRECLKKERSNPTLMDKDKRVAMIRKLEI